MFVGQLALDGIGSLEEGLLGPRRGMLSFFYDVENGAWGVDPGDRDRFAVVYSPSSSEELVPHQWPEDSSSDSVFEARELRPEGRLYLPPSPSMALDDLDLSSDQESAYFDLLDLGCGEINDVGAYLGHPYQVQGDMMWECAMVTAGIYCGDAEAHKSDQGKALRATSSEWCLLFQVPTCEEIGMWWGDSGFLYYCIHADDLAALRFEKSWMVLQCC